MKTIIIHAGKHAAYSVYIYICHVGFVAQLCNTPWAGMAAAVLCVPQRHTHGDTWIPARTAAHIAVLPCKPLVLSLSLCLSLCVSTPPPRWVGFGYMYGNVNVFVVKSSEGF